METPIDRQKNAFAVVHHALAQGKRVDFLAGVLFEPKPVSMVFEEREGIAFAATQDQRLWMGAAEGLRPGEVPTIWALLIGNGKADIGRARTRWETYARLVAEVQSGQTEKG